MCGKGTGLGWEGEWVLQLAGELTEAGGFERGASQVHVLATLSTELQKADPHSHINSTWRPLPTREPHRTQTMHTKMRMYLAHLAHSLRRCTPPNIIHNNARSMDHSKPKYTCMWHMQYASAHQTTNLSRTLSAPVETSYMSPNHTIFLLHDGQIGLQEKGC